jgi:hypothetical protein
MDQKHKAAKTTPIATAFAFKNCACRRKIGF